MNNLDTKSYNSPRQVNASASRLLDHSFQFFQHHIPTEFVLLGLAEFAAFIFAFYVGIEVRFWNVEMTRESLVGPLLPKAFIFAVAMQLCMISLGTYQRSSNSSFGITAVRVAGAMVLGMVPITLSFYFAPMFFLGRGALALAVSVSFINILSVRAIFHRILKHSRLNPRILVLGAGNRAKLIKDAQLKGELNGLNIVGYSPMNSESHEVSNDEVFNSQHSLIDLVEEHLVDQIVVAVDDRRKAMPIQEILDCKMSGVSVVDMLTFFERETGKIRLDILQPSWLFLSEGFRQTVLRRLGKRVFDIAISLILLPVAAPLMLLVACCVYIEGIGRSPVLYRQVRVGENGKPFEIIKFRSMRTDAESDGVARWAQRNDRRITRIGAIIRRTRLDELPQLFNVLRGDMSFVGPRPERPEFTRELGHQIPYYNERHRVKPGLTGWAQIRYAYGASAEDAVEKLQYDLYYVKNYSIFMDLVVLLQTAEVVVLGKGAH